MVERGRKEEGGEVPGRRRGRGRGRRRGRGRDPSSSGSSLAAVEGEQGPVAEHGRGRRDGRVGAALAGVQARRTEGAEQGAAADGWGRGVGDLASEGGREATVRVEQV